MSYTVKVKKPFSAKQGLASPIRRDKSLPALQPADGYKLVLKVGIQFDDSKLNDKGWFIDTDAIDDQIEVIIKHLSSKKWTELFEFRPTFELVTRWVFRQLELHIEGLFDVTLTNQTLGVTVRYTKE